MALVTTNCWSCTKLQGLKSLLNLVHSDFANGTTSGMLDSNNEGVANCIKGFWELKMPMAGDRSLELLSARCSRPLGNTNTSRFCEIHGKQLVGSVYESRIQWFLPPHSTAWLHGVSVGWGWLKWSDIYPNYWHVQAWIVYACQTRAMRRRSQTRQVWITNVASLWLGLQALSHPGPAVPCKHDSGDAFALDTQLKQHKGPNWFQLKQCF